MARRLPGVLEAEILGLMARSDRALTPSEIRDGLGDDLAYTTITTALSRLGEKGLVARVQKGRGYSYAVAVDESSLVAERMQTQLRLSGNTRGVLQRFASELSQSEAEDLMAVLRERDDQS